MVAGPIEPGVKAVIIVSGDGTGALTTLATDISKAEDAAHVTADKGYQMLGVRRDAPVQDADTAGDYTHPIFDAKGRMWATHEKTGHYETVAASQTDNALGATGAAGDYLDAVLIVPATTGAGTVSIKDGAGSAINIYVTGTLSDLKPFRVELGLISLSGAWKITTGANVSAIGMGRFT